MTSDDHSNCNQGILFLKVYRAALLAWRIVAVMVRNFDLLVNCLHQRLLFDLFRLQMKSLCLGLCSCDR
jgi:hypothetical protein